MDRHDLSGPELRRIISLELTIEGGGFFLLYKVDDSSPHGPITVDRLVTRFDLETMTDTSIMSAIDRYLAQFSFMSIGPELDPFGKNLGWLMSAKFRTVLCLVKDGDPKIGIGTTDGIPLGRVAVTHGDAVFKLEPKFRIDEQVTVSVANETSNMTLLWTPNPDLINKEFFWHMDTSFPSKRFHRGKPCFSKVIDS